MFFETSHHIWMFRVCHSYLSANKSLDLGPSDCSIIYSLNTSQAEETINHVNTHTNQWIKVGIRS